MDQDEARLVLLELQRRSSLKATKIDFVDHKFPKQAKFIEDRSPLISALCTRRAGKSYGAGLKAHDVLFNKHVGSMALYIGLTKDSARRILWNNVVKDINKRFNLGGNPHETFLCMTYPNGSMFQLVGADVKPEEMEKFLGGKYSIVIIDEAGSYRQDIRKLVYDNLEPAVADYDGQIILTGTPSPLIRCFFADVSQGKEKGWTRHKWTTYDNPYMEEKWRIQEKRVKERDPNIVNTPAYRRNRLAEWVIDNEEYVYRFKRERDTIEKLPSDIRDATCIIGVDLGFDDPTAFSVLGYFPNDGTLYGVENFKRKGMIVSDVAATLRILIDKYHPIKIIVDNASKQVTEEIRQRYGIPLESAEKHGKADFIEIMNSDFMTNRIKFLSSTCAPLFDEYEKLVWDEEQPKRVEHESCENHLCDATLYAWRYCYSYLEREVDNRRLSDEELMDEYFEREIQKMSEEDERPWWEK